MSFATRGMLAYVLSKPEGWETRPLDIEREGNIGKDARRKIMKEAEIAGYLTFHVDRNPKGQIECWYDAHEEPVSEEERTKSWEMNKSQAQPDAENPQVDDDEPPAENPQVEEGKPGAGLPPAGEPPTGQPATGEPVSGLTASGKPAAHVEKKEVQKTDLENTEREITEREVSPREASIAAILVAAYKNIANDYRDEQSLQYQITTLENLKYRPVDVETWLSERRSLPAINFIARDFKTWLENRSRRQAQLNNGAKSNEQPRFESAAERSTRRLVERDYEAIAARVYGSLPTD